MKIAACFVALTLFAVAMSEECRDAQDCHHVTCPEVDYSLECHTHQCTCTHQMKTCVAKEDCSLPDCQRDVHCIDGQCRCGFGFIGGFMG